MTTGGGSERERVGPPAAPPVDDRQIPVDDARPRDWRATGYGVLVGGLVAEALSRSVGLGQPGSGVVLSIIGGGMVLLAWLRAR